MSEHGNGANGHATAVAMPKARSDDPRQQPLTKYPARVEKIIAASLFLGMLGFASFGADYWLNAKPLLYGLSLGFGMIFMGFGMTAWGKYLMPQGPFVEERHVLRSTDDERTSMAAALVERSAGIGRRKMLGGLLAAGSGIFGIVAVFPLLRSLGPLPKKQLDVTNWKAGSKLVDADGRPVSVNPESFGVGSVLTVFPEGYESNDQAISVDQTVVVRVGLSDFTTREGRETWGPQGFLAYSKMCTHLGCPVGLYEQELELLVCPCHQSMFAVYTGCEPIFGPAPRPLPQLPLYVDDDGYLRAQAAYDQPVGPGFWERS